MRASGLRGFLDCVGELVHGDVHAKGCTCQLGVDARGWHLRKISALQNAKNLVAVLVSAKPGIWYQFSTDSRWWGAKFATTVCRAPVAGYGPKHDWMAWSAY